MNRFSKTLLAVVAAFMVANPVLACCLTMSMALPAQESTDSSTSSVPAKPPCHGAEVSTPNIGTLNDLSEAQSDCSSCGDCSTMMAAAEHPDPTALPHSVYEVELLESHYSETLSGSVAQVAVVNIPKPDHAALCATPQSLKLKLQI